MKKWVLTVVLSSLFVFPLLLRANSTSQILVTKGLIAFDDGEYEEALDYFKEAVKADPGDEEAVYYLGKAYLKLGEEKKGVYFLKKTPYPEARFELGQFYFKKGKFERAVKYFLNYAELESDATAYYYAGVSYFNMGRLKEATRYLSISYDDPDLKAASAVFLGLIRLRQRDFKGAEKFFKVAARTGSDDIRKKAKDYLSQIEELLRPTSAWGVNMGLGFEYDTNVFVLPEKDVAVSYGFPDEEVENPSSAGMYLNFQPYFDLTLTKRRNVRFNSTFNVTQRLYFSSEAQKYNILQTDWNNFLVVGRGGGELIFPLSLSFYYLTQEKQKYGNFWEIGMIYAKGKMNENRWLAGMKLSGEFYGYGNVPDSRIDRNGLKLSLMGEKDIGIKRLLYISLAASGVYFYSLSSADENDWKRVGVELMPSFEFRFNRLAAGMGFNLSYLYFLDDNSYSSADSSDEYRRQDFYYQISGYLMYSLAKWTNLSFYYSYMNDSSNIDVFSYERSIIGLRWGIVF